MPKTRARSPSPRSRDTYKYKSLSRRSRSKSRDNKKIYKPRDKTGSADRSYFKNYRDNPKDKFKEEKSKSRQKSKLKSKKRHSSSDSSSSSSNSSRSSSSSSSSIELLEKLKAERLKVEEEKKKRKELMKLNETPEEKRLRRLKKKEAKERLRKERMGWDNEYLHYTNTDNPFGDGNLLSTFVWTKKLSKEGLIGVSSEELELRNRHKQEENKRELEKVKKRRQERELERQQREDEMQLMQRNKEAAQFEEWERQEDQFHLEQARLRSHIRIQDGRAKPIDLLAKYINTEEEVDAVEMHEPYTYLNGLQVKDLEDLVEDIKVYKELERGKNLDYWNDITVIVQDELHKLRKLIRQNEYDMMNRREGIHQAVEKDVTNVFKGKTTTQLAQLQKSIEDKINSKSDGLDIGYWESLLSQLKAHMARARLRDRHQENLRKKLELLKAEQAVTIPIKPDYNQPPEIFNPQTELDKHNESTISPDPDPGAGPSNRSPDNNSPILASEQNELSQHGSSASTENIDEETKADDDVENYLRESFDSYESGGYSPKYLSPIDLDPGTIVVTEIDDYKRLEYARGRVQGKGNQQESIVSKEELLLIREARKGMDDDEAQFSVETSLDSQVYLWSDKYRPRKPRYFNRVHTGFEWNKYNQTHYDMDNPPPKIVQGYKFNIFYPDLIDKNKTPEYFLTPCPENREFAILRFHAGPPYEDIAFKIVSREWEYSYKRGFRCQFHNNIFQLWFHFKRYRYRR